MLLTLEINEKQLDESPRVIAQYEVQNSAEWERAYDIIATRAVATRTSMDNAIDPHGAAMVRGYEAEGKVWAAWPTYEVTLQDDMLTITFDDIDEGIHLDEVWTLLLPAVQEILNPVIGDKPNG